MPRPKHKLRMVGSGGSREGVPNELPNPGAGCSSAPPMHVASANAQPVYVAPGGVYIGAGPVYVIPAPNYAGAGYGAPTYSNEYGPPSVAAPHTVVAPTEYGSGGDYYGTPLSTYGAELPPRPPLAVPSHRN